MYHIATIAEKDSFTHSPRFSLHDRGHHTQQTQRQWDIHVRACRPLHVLLFARRARVACRSTQCCVANAILRRCKVLRAVQECRGWCEKDRETANDTAVWAWAWAWAWAWDPWMGRLAHPLRGDARTAQTRSDHRHAARYRCVLHGRPQNQATVQRRIGSLASRDAHGYLDRRRKEGSAGPALRGRGSAGIVSLRPKRVISASKIDQFTLFIHSEGQADRHQGSGSTTLSIA